MIPQSMYGGQPCGKVALHSWVGTRGLHGEAPVPFLWLRVPATSANG